MVVRRLGQGREAVILDVEPDEPHIAAGKALNRAVRGVLEGVSSGSAFF